MTQPPPINHEAQFLTHMAKAITSYKECDKARLKIIGDTIGDCGLLLKLMEDIDDGLKTIERAKAEAALGGVQ